MIIQSILSRKSKFAQISILVKCPKCGRWGRLNRNSSTNAMHVLHGKREYCRHGWTHPEFNNLKTIFYANRMKDGITDNYRRNK